MLPAADIDKFNVEIEKANAVKMPKPLPNYEGSDLQQLVNDCITQEPPRGAEVKERLDSILSRSQKDYKIYTNRKLMSLLGLLVPGVDETIDGRFTYRGFNRFQNPPPLLNAAMAGVNILQKLATWCHHYLTDFASLGAGQPNEKQAWTREKYVLWFDAQVDPTRREKVRDIFDQLNQEINQKDFMVLCDAAEGRDPIIFSQANPGAICAFVRKAEHFNRIYLCDRFFDEEEFKGKRACSLLHELTHLEHIGDTEDIPKDANDVSGMQQNARSAPQVACNNAENYARFARELVQKGGVVL